MNAAESIKELEILKQNILSDDWELVKGSADGLATIGGDDVVEFLISLLESENPITRNGAALALEQIGDNRAVEPLLKAVFKKENHGCNGTMVFALESLDCSSKLKEIFKILFYETYEARMSAESILSEQVFEFTRDDLNEISEMWQDCQLHSEKCPEIENDEVRISIQNSVDGFLAYLKEDRKY